MGGLAPEGCSRTQVEATTASFALNCSEHCALLTVANAEGCVSSALGEDPIPWEPFLHESTLTQTFFCMFHPISHLGRWVMKGFVWMEAARSAVLKVLLSREFSSGSSGFSHLTALRCNVKILISREVLFPGNCCLV